MVLPILITAVVAYFLGNFNGAIIVSKLIANEDVRTKGSGNAGLTNFTRNYGARASIFVILIDVGVAVAQHPEGPFMPMWRPIEGLHGIDPCVLIDPKDGKAYIYWAGMGMWMARLKDNMMELDSEPQQVQKLPEGFKEGPFVFSHGGKYYYTFPWVRDSTETLAYAMGDSPMPTELQGRR